MNEIYKHFSKTVNDYDTVADKVVFKNDELHKVLIGAIPFVKKSKIAILDLGCGTGHGMKILAQKFKNAEITGIDYSQIMIEKAKEHLESCIERVQLVCKDFNKIKFEKYDAVISAITIHNSTDHQKIDLFKKIFDSLDKGGVFINADFYIPESKKMKEQVGEIYRNFLKSNLSGDELEAWIKHAFSEDMPMKLTEQFETLKRAGFSKVELLWIYNNEAIYRATK